jgi:hypothetical protein
MISTLLLIAAGLVLGAPIGAVAVYMALIFTMKRAHA